jgi:hypothetical protein
MENIRFMAQKIGLMGLVAASITPPPKKPGETEGEYQVRATNYLKSIKTALDGNFSNGLIATFKDQKIDHTPVTTGAQGVYDLNRMSEEQVFSGMAAMPGFHGRTDATTETFADVVYYLLTAQVANMQRIVKRRQERTYMLDLRLGGIDVDAVSLAFNKAHSRNGLNEAQTEDQKFKTVLAKVEKGLITPDEGAQELGYDSWFDAELVTAVADGFANAKQSQGRSFSRDNKKTVRLSYNSQTRRYEYRPEVLQLSSGDEDDDTADNVVPILKKKALRASN